MSTLAVAAGVAAISMSFTFCKKPISVQCEAATKVVDNDDSSYTPVPNPVWPAGICEADIDVLVQDCLNDPTINIPTVPDYLERQIYRSTIKLTLNAM